MVAELGGVMHLIERVHEFRFPLTFISVSLQMRAEMSVMSPGPSSSGRRSVISGYSTPLLVWHCALHRLTRQNSAGLP